MQVLVTVMPFLLSVRLRKFSRETSGVVWVILNRKRIFLVFVKFICKNNYSSFQGSLFKQTVSYRCFTGKLYWKFPWQHSQGSLVFVKLKLHQNLKSFRKSAEHLFLSSYLAVSFFVLKLFLKSTWKKPGVMHVRDHSFSTFAQYSERLTILTPWYALVRMRIRG